MDDNKIGINTIDNDIICIIIMQFMKYPQNRNIRKIKRLSDYCLIYNDDKNWCEVKDDIAIPKFMSKYIPYVMGQLMYMYENIGEKQNDKQYVKKITFVMYTINEILNGNRLFIESVFHQMRELIFYITKKYNPEIITE